MGTCGVDHGPGVRSGAGEGLVDEHRKTLGQERDRLVPVVRAVPVRDDDGVDQSQQPGGGVDDLRDPSGGRQRVVATAAPTAESHHACVAAGLLDVEVADDLVHMAVVGADDADAHPESFPSR